MLRTASIQASEGSVWVLAELEPQTSVSMCNTFQNKTDFVNISEDKMNSKFV